MMVDDVVVVSRTFKTNDDLFVWIVRINRIPRATGLRVALAASERGGTDAARLSFFRCGQADRAVGQCAYALTAFFFLAKQIDIKTKKKKL